MKTAKQTILREMAQKEVENLVWQFNVLRTGPLTQEVINQKADLTQQVNELIKEFNL